MGKIILTLIITFTVLPLWAEADLGRLSALGFSVPENRTAAPELEAWRNGEKVTLVPAGKPVLLYFWGSQVPGSMADLPLLDDLYKILSEEPCGQTLTVAPVNLNDESALVGSYADKADLTLPLYLFPESPLLEPYIMKSVPSLWLIDSRGRAAAVCEGNVPWGHPDLMRSLREFADE